MARMEIEGVITLPSGEKVQFFMSQEGVSRWGNTTAHLGQSVAPTEAMWDALSDMGYFRSDDNETDAGDFGFVSF